MTGVNSYMSEIDVDETMTRLEALELAINALSRDETSHAQAGRYSSATDAFTARQILERLRDEQ